jgi:L-aspartate oxidase
MPKNSARAAKVETGFDFLVIGSGIAGLSFALKAAPYGRVAVVTKREADECNTRYAQGGIASVLHARDSFDAHVQDTLVAGAGLCNSTVVKAVVHDGPARIEDLRSWGVRFSRRPEQGKRHEFDLTQEGGHSARRILHARDLTGLELERALLKAVRTHPRIRLFEHHMGVDLLVKRGACVGAHVFDAKANLVRTLAARATVLATGGSGKVYLYTTNPDVATGDGVAMAWRAGAKVAGLEFFQFHPTCLFHPQAHRFLLSEALRGEGALLRDKRGRRFMPRFHAQAELAPRDVVARAIDQVMKETGDEHVLLDITHRDPAWLRKRFPGIDKTLRGLGIDFTKERVPVVPAAHYQCGGVATDINGSTSLPRLYALGECAHTGLHGANRLASNSLLEAVVVAHRAAFQASQEKALPKALKVAAWQTGRATDSKDAVVVTNNWDELRRTMWNYVGIVRTNKRLERAQRRIQLLKKEIHQYYWEFLVTRDLLELRNIATVAELIIRAARARRESRGLHYNLDYPAKNDRKFLRPILFKRRQWEMK